MINFKCLLVLVVVAFLGVGCDGGGSVPGDDGSQTDTGKAETPVDAQHPPCDVTVQRSGTVSPGDPCEAANLGRCTSADIAYATFHPPQTPTSFHGTCEAGCLIEVPATATAPATDVIVPLNSTCDGYVLGTHGTCSEVRPSRTESATVFSCE